MRPIFHQSTCQIQPECATGNCDPAELGNLVPGTYRQADKRDQVQGPVWSLEGRTFLQQEHSEEGPGRECSRPVKPKGKPASNLRFQICLDCGSYHRFLEVGQSLPPPNSQRSVDEFNLTSTSGYLTSLPTGNTQDSDGEYSSSEVTRPLPRSYVINGGTLLTTFSG